MRSVIRGLLLVAIVISSAATRAVAQGTYALGNAAYWSSGCTGPSPCACPVNLVGPLGGTFELVHVGTTGSLDEYAVLDIDWFLGSQGPLPVATPISGTGTYRVDRATGLQDLTLDLLVGGTAHTFQSTGSVSGGTLFPDGIVIDVFEPIPPGPCLYEGIHLIAGIVQPRFQRGDCNGDGSRSIADPVTLLGALFGPGPVSPPCPDACDANDDGALNIADAVTALNALFAGGVLPPPVACGEDPTADALGCASPPGC